MLDSYSLRGITFQFWDLANLKMKSLYVLYTIVRPPNKKTMLMNLALDKQ